MARKYSFVGIELFYEDLRDVASSMPGGCTDRNQIRAAAQIRKWCGTRGLEIICLQPFMHYEGLLDRKQHRKNIITLELWTDLAHELETDLIVFPSSFLKAELLSDDISVSVSDFAEAADIGLRRTPPIRFAFEALCWGTRVDTWEASWDIVTAVDRPNFGLCLDTFNIAGRVYDDPASFNGCTPRCEADMSKSMNKLLGSIDINKVFLLQVADAERLSQPLDNRHPYYDASQPARMSWSRNCRLFYGEQQYGGYLPIQAILETIVHGLGYRGWMSFEVFNRMTADTDKKIPEILAGRASESWKNMAKDLKLQTVEDAKAAHHELERAAL
jgi:4-hydroxyphenylpyruvate dioxygenase